MGMSCHILVVNEEKKNVNLIKNWSCHQFVSHVYTKLTDTNEITNGAHF